MTTSKTLKTPTDQTAEIDDRWHLQAPAYVLDDADLERKKDDNPDSRKDWHVGINAIKAWDLTRGKDIKVVIFDTGVEIDHPSLKNVDRHSACDFDHTFLGDKLAGPGTRIANPVDAHGTACAGLVGAVDLYDANDQKSVRVVGVAPECTLIPVRISTNFEVGSLIGALDYAASVGDVILLPRYLPESKALTATLDAIGSRMPIVCAAGNDGLNSLIYPARLEIDDRRRRLQRARLSLDLQPVWPGPRRRGAQQRHPDRDAGADEVGQGNRERPSARNPRRGSDARRVARGACSSLVQCCAPGALRRGASGFTCFVHC